MFKQGKGIEHSLNSGLQNATRVSKQVFLQQLSLTGQSLIKNGAACILCRSGSTGMILHLWGRGKLRCGPKAQWQ